jgi:hypothetical protein
VADLGRNMWLIVTECYVAGTVEFDGNVIISY